MAAWSTICTIHIYQVEDNVQYPLTCLLAAKLPPLLEGSVATGGSISSCVVNAGVGPTSDFEGYFSSFTGNVMICSPKCKQVNWATAAGGNYIT